jgi:FAD/FMN-containing dehydrogenase
MFHNLYDSLRRHFGGDIIEPGAAGYDAARRTLLTSGSPALVLQPKTVEDVQAAVRFAAEARRPLSVRGGGHSFAGFGTNDDGTVLDLAGLATVEVDAAHRRARVGGGATWGDVAAALAPHGLAISAGDTKSVGVGGLTLSGGIGWKVRKYGLALDSLVAAEVVVADGSAVRASADENPGLFWALRGGGGNFGVVTAFEFTAHPTTDVFYGRIAFPGPQAADVLQGWADHLRTAPDELTSVACLANPAAGGHEAPIEIYVVVDGDDPRLAAGVLDPIRRLGTVIADDIALTPYANTLDEGGALPPGFRVMTRGAFVDRDSVPQVLRILTEVAQSEGTPFFGLRSVTGATARVADDATAYAHRGAELMLSILTGGPEPAAGDAAKALDAAWHRLAPYVSGVYANFHDSATEADVAAIYPPGTYERLAAVKRRYDPRNLFASNHNIRPS